MNYKTKPLIKNCKKQFYFNSILLSTIFMLAFHSFSFSQSYDSLSQLNGYKVKVYHSDGAAARANQIALRCDKVIKYYKPILGFEPSVNVLILSAVDWIKYSAKGAVYGMPHYTNSQTLVVASEDNPFWQSMVPPIDKLPKELADNVVKTYSDKNGNLTVQSFFDLLAIHELGHAYHNQFSVKMQRKWMGELFPNILLHTYIAEHEPELLPALMLFPQIVIVGGTTGLSFTSLSDFEEKYNEIAQKNPRNYGWYQCKLHAAAARIYTVGGTKVIARLWNTLKENKNILNDKDFISMLADEVHQSVADVYLKWDAR
jgi:hypothetical protein